MDKCYLTLQVSTSHMSVQLSAVYSGKLRHIYCMFVVLIIDLFWSACVSLYLVGGYRARSS